TVLGDDKPFTEAETHFADAKYYFKYTKPVEKLPSKQHKGSESEEPKIEKVENSLKELVLLLPKINNGKPISQPPTKFVRPSNGAVTEYGERLKNSKCFDPKAYKLLVKAGYNLNKSCSLGKLIPQEQKHNRAGLGYVASSPIRIAIKRENANHVSEGEFSSSDSEKKEKRVSVFQRLGPVRKSKGKQSVFQRLGSFKQSKPLRQEKGVGPSPKLRSQIPS
ncbi:Unknown protein, partial [Striga hermonthica]